MWLNFRIDHAEQAVWWKTSDDPIEGDYLLNVEVPPPWEAEPERLLTRPGSATLCNPDCGGGDVQLLTGVSAGTHGPQCPAMPGWENRVVPLPPSVLRPETPTP